MRTFPSFTVVARRARFLAAAALLLPGCGSMPGLGGPGVATEVHLLAGGFARFEGQRMPVDAFLLEIRRRIRAADGDTARYPAVRVLVEADLPPGRIDALLRELQAAGVRHVTLG